MNRARRSGLFVACLAVAGLAVACGGAAKLEHAPSSTQTPSEPTSIEEAQAQIADARGELGGASLGAAESTPAGDATTKAGEERRPKRSADPSADKATDAADACHSPCRAIGSMRRAVGALCRMAGDADGRCLDARRTLKESETRVAPCGC
jgi:hypothetical protein